MCHKKYEKTEKNTLHVFSLILFHPFTRTLHCLLFINLTLILFWLSLKQIITLQSNALQVRLKNNLLYSVVLLKYLCMSSFRHAADTNPLYSLLVCPFHWRQTWELSEFHSRNPEIFSLPSHLPLSSTPTSPFLFLIPATLHLCNLAPSKLCYFYTRAGEQSVRAGEWRRRWCRFPGFFRAPSSNLAHLPPSASL